MTSQTQSMYMDQNIKDRIAQLEEYVENVQIDRATKRFIDFTKDFSHDRKWERQAIILRGNYTTLADDIRIEGKTSSLDSRERRLRRDILEALHQLLDEELSGNSEKNSSAVKPEFRTEEISPVHPQNDTPLILENDSLTDRNIVDRGLSTSQGRNQSELNGKIAFQGHDISRVYKSKAIQFSLERINIKLKLGQITVIVGENGSGKTTLLEMVAGIYAASSGTIEYPFLMQNSRFDNRYAIRQQIAYMPPELKKWPGNLEDMLYFASSIHGKRGQEIIDSVDLIISRLSLEKYRNASWSQISSGIKTRFALANILARNPKLVVLDEPLANLDINAQILFLQDLKDLTNSATYPIATIISSQHIQVVEDIADNIIFLKNGKAIYNGKASLIGEERIENSFELRVNLGKKQLSTLLTKANIEFLRIEGEYRYFIVHTKKTVLSSRLLGSLLNNDITIESFHDISRSTRLLF